MSREFEFRMSEYVNQEEHSEMVFSFNTVCGVYDIVSRFEGFLKACGYDIHSLTVNMDNPKLFETKKNLGPFTNMKAQAPTGETQYQAVPDISTPEEQEYWNEMAKAKRETIKKEALHHPV